MIVKRKVKLFLGVIVFLNITILGGFLSIFWIKGDGESWYELVTLIMIAEGMYLIYGTIVFGAWFIKRHLPDVHVVVNPLYSASVARVSSKGELLIEEHYLLTYSLSSGIGFYNRRCFKDFDFKNLSPALLYPLKVFCLLFVLASLFLSLLEL